MAGHGSPRPEDKAEHPNRKVALEALDRDYRENRVQLSTEDWMRKNSGRLGEEMRHDRTMGNG